MDPAFWASRWQEGRIGFHEGRPNELLARHHAVLGEQRRVLVPLCGKTVDLRFLADAGHQVIGVELIESAAQAFFREQGLAAERVERGGMTAYESGPVTIVTGDFFQTTRGVLGPIDALYDRAALIALPSAMRQRYAAHVRSLMPRAATGLVVTLEYAQEQMEGPPFAVLEEEVLRLYDGLTVQLLDRAKALGLPPRSADLLASEACFRVQFD